MMLTQSEALEEEEEDDDCSAGTCDPPMQFKTTNPVFQDKLLSDLRSALDRGIYSDLDLPIRNTTFRLHKIVLASSSPFFASKFAGDNSDFTHLEQCDPSALKHLFRFLYEGKLEIAWTEAGSLLHATFVTQVEHIVDFCLATQEKIEVSFDNCLLLLQLARDNPEVSDMLPSLLAQAKLCEDQLLQQRDKSLICFTTNNDDGQLQNDIIDVKISGEVTTLWKISTDPTRELCACVAEDGVYVSGFGSDWSDILRYNTHEVSANYKSGAQ